MVQIDTYNTIGKEGEAIFRDRGSRFIAYASPVNSIEACKKNLELLKKQHPKADHHCFAYRLGLDKNLFRVNDDGEPSGTAGRPILAQIDSRELTDIQIVVVRYFGGTLLGVPGLINAYKNAAALALQVTPIIQKPIEENYELDFDYTMMNEVMMVLRQLNCTTIRQDLNMFCHMEISIPRSRITEALYRFGEIRNVAVKKAVTG